MSGAPIPTRQEYNRRNEFENREWTARELANTYRKDTNILVPYGKTLGFTGPSGEQVILSYDGTDFEISIDGVTLTLTSSADFSAIESEVIAARDGEASLLAQVNTLQSADVSNGSAISTLSSEVVAARDGEASLTAKISNVETAFADADTAIASNVSTLTAEVTTARDGEASLFAKISTVETAAADADSAAATAQSEITAARDGEASLLAKVNAIDSAVATADSAAATAQSEISAARDGESSLLAKVNAVESAFASADSAISSSVSTLSSEVTDARDGESTLLAQVNTMQAATASVDGKLSASYGVTVDAGGRIASLKLLSDGTTSSVKFLATTFSVYNGTTDEAPFTVEGGVVKANTVVAGAIDTAELAAGAVEADKINVTTLSAISANMGTITAGSITADTIDTGTLNVARITTGDISTAYYQETAASYTVTTSWVTIASAEDVVVPTGGVVKIDWSMFGNIGNTDGADSGKILVQILRDSTSIYDTTGLEAAASQTVIFPDTSSQDLVSYASAQFAGFDIDEPSSGTYDYHIQVKKDRGVSTVEDRRIIAVVYKK